MTETRKITLKLRFVEGGKATYHFKTLEGAQKRAHYHLGPHPEMGASYAADGHNGFLGSRGL